MTTTNNSHIFEEKDLVVNNECDVDLILKIWLDGEWTIMGIRIMKDLIGWCRLHARILSTEGRLPEASYTIFIWLIIRAD